MTRLIAILLFIASSPASAACLGKISQAAAPSSLSYNPFAVQNTLQAILVTIQNPGTQPCSYQLTIPSASYPLQFGGKLSFGIAPAGAAPAPQSTTPLTVLTSQVKPGQAVRVPLALTIFSGQPAASGLLMGNVNFSLYAAGAAPSQSPLDQVQVPLSCAIPAIFEINIAGSGQYTSVDFGELAPGKSATVVLQMRATADYSLHFRSQNNGYLVRGGSNSPGNSRISYGLTVDGLPIALSGPAFLQFKARAGETSRRFSFTIGEMANTMAGLYKDIITVRIASYL
ncbi:MAG: hypothetical protein ACLQKK_17730 [Rhodomicrobium sp.]